MATYTLSDSGVQAIASPGSLAIVITVFPSGLEQGNANPTNWYHLGLLRLGNTHGYLPAVPVDATNMLLPCPNGATLLGYKLRSGVTITAEERAEQPYAGPTGPPGSTGATGATGATGPSGQTLISDTTLIATAANFDLTSIPGTYSHLRVFYLLRGTQAVQASVFHARLNNDSGANYWSENRTSLATSTSSVNNATTTQISGPHMPGTSDTQTAEFAVGEMIVPFYTASHNKVVQFHNYMPPTGGTNVQENASHMGYWRNSAAVTRITLFPSANNFEIGSRVQLYGVA